MTRVLAAGLCVVAALFAGGPTGFRAGPDPSNPPAVLHGIHYAPPRAAPDIKGIDTNGMAFALRRQPHPLALVLFGYVSCTDVCPTNLKRMQAVQQLLGKNVDQLLIVFVSIDPEHESPKLMRDHLAHFGGEIVGVTAAYESDLEPAYKAWGVVRKRVTLAHPMMGRTWKFQHTGEIFLVQGGTKLVASYPFGTHAETMADDVRALLADPSMGARLPAVGAVHEVTLPPGSFTRRGVDHPSIPGYLRLHVGESVRWTNHDYTYHFIGDIALAPGDAATQTFDHAGTFYLGCTALPGEAIRIAVRADGAR